MKKWLVGMLITTLCVPQMAFASASNKPMDEELKNVILTVKNIISIPEAYTKFNYDVETKHGVDEENYYTMQWTNEDNEQGLTRVVADEEGHLINYETINYQEGFSEKVNLSYEEGYKIATDFMKNALKDIAGVMKDGEYVKPSKNNTYTYLFDHYVNGVKVRDEGVRIEINKATGVVSQYVAFEPFEGIYEKVEKPISKEMAEQNYLRDIGISLVYKLKYPEKTKAIESFPAYITLNPGNKGIEAKTGKVITPFFEPDYRPYAKNALAENVAMDSAGSRLSPAEEKAVKENRGLLTKEAAKDCLNPYFKGVANTDIINAGLSYDQDSKQYLWDLHLEDSKKEHPAISARIDAKSGEILYYSDYTYDKEVKSTLSYDQAKKEVEKFLTTIVSEKFAQTKLKAATKEEQEESVTYNFEYERIVNGATVMGNSLSATYNADKKEVCYYNNNWSNTSFKAVDKVLSKEKAIKNMDLELVYVAKDVKTKVQAYVCKDTSITLEPFNGKRIRSYDGEPYNENNTKVIYSDLKGNAIEPIVKALHDRGIALEGNTFRPNEAIKQIDFIRLLMGNTSLDTKEKDLLDEAVRRKILAKEEIAPEQTVTVNQMAHYVINDLGYGKIAALKGIYNPTIVPGEVSDLERGYLTLAYGLGIVDKELLASVGEKTPLTRAQSAKVIYQMLQYKEQ